MMDTKINYLRMVIAEHKALLLEIAMLGRQMRNVQTVYFKTEAQKALVEKYESKFDKAIDEVLLNLRRECDADGFISIPRKLA